MMQHETEGKASERDLGRIERVQIFATRILRTAQEEVAKRSQLETRWLTDLRQYEGQYDPATVAQMANDPTRSKVFINLTRARCNELEARLIDMLFPTDDKNWGIKPTPMPEVSSLRKEVKQQGDNDSVDEIDAVLELAEKAAEHMEREIDDQLCEADYNSVAREVCHDSVLYGTGVIKGPVIIGRTKKIWRSVEDENGESVSVLEIIEKKEPTVQHVSIWNYFPDSNAIKVGDAAYELERHYMTRRDLRDLLKAQGFFHQEIVNLLKEGPSRTNDDNGRMSQMRSISGLQSMSYLDNRYEVWEYHGAVERGELEDMGVELDDEDIAEFDAVIFVCNNRVIKAAINPLETSDHPYSVVSWQKDESSVFGKGVPWMMRDSQGVVNAAWRTMIENMGLSSGDQIVVDRKAIKPVDGKWRLSPRKLWWKTDQSVPVNAAFATFPIASHQAELMGIVDAASKLADEELSAPRLMYGESPGASAQTMGGMSMLMNAANVVLRRAIKNFDDNITSPLLKRFYDFNMQFSKKEEIKGDFNVHARGSSALLVKEQQAQALMQLMQLAAQPGFTEITKMKNLYKKVIQSMHLEADDILKSDDEIEAMQQQSQQQPPADPAAIRAQSDMQIVQMKIQAQQQLEQMKADERLQERELRLQEAEIEREIAVMRLSSDRDMTIEQINGRLQEAKMKHQSDWRLLVGETQVKARFGSGI